MAYGAAVGAEGVEVVEDLKEVDPHLFFFFFWGGGEERTNKKRDTVEKTSQFFFFWGGVGWEGGKYGKDTKTMVN